MRISFIFILIAIHCSCSVTTAKTYFTQASKLEDENKFTEAIKLLDKAIEKDSNYIPAYINRAVDKTMLGNYKGAIQDYNIVIRKKPNNTKALFNRGKNKHRLLDYKGAIQDFQRAIESKGGEEAWIDLQPNDYVEAGYDSPMVEIRLERGVSYYFTGNLNLSYKDIQFCIDKNFERKIALYWRAMIYLSTDKKEKGCVDLRESSALGNMDSDKEIGRFCE